MAGTRDPVPPGLLDTVMRVPRTDCSRARNELEWSPARTPGDVLREFFEGLSSGAVGSGPPGIAIA